MHRFTSDDLRELAASFLRYGSAYAAGTWTPTYYGSTTAGTTTYTAQYGRYTRVVDMVFCTFRVSWSAVTGTGSGLVGGLPFAPGADVRVVWTILSENHGYTNAGLRGFVFDSLSYITLYDQVVGALAPAPIDAAGNLIGTGFYFI